MKINQIALRQKESRLLSSPNNKMSIKIDSQEPNIISNENNLIQLLKTLSVRIMHKETVIAKFVITMQCEVELEQDEKFITAMFDKMILPLILFLFESNDGRNESSFFPNIVSLYLLIR